MHKIFVYQTETNTSPESIVEIETRNREKEMVSKFTNVSMHTKILQ